MDRLEAGLRKVTIHRVTVRPDQSFVNPEWKRMGTSELKKCLEARVYLSVGKSKSVVTVEPLGDAPGISVASRILSQVPRAKSASIEKLMESGSFPVLASIVRKVMKMYEEEVGKFSRDRNRMGRLNSSFRELRRKMAFEVVTKAFSEAADLMTFDEMKDLWDLAQVESVLKS